MSTFFINKQEHSVEGSLRDETLLNYLRDTLRLTGTKCGCDEGTCGSCTVIIEGEATRSCLVKLGQLNGKHVMTIEGLSQPEKLHPIQSAFIECSAIQCGFCTPGVIMASKALLDKDTSPSDREIAKALSGVLCRCGAYPRIIQAVHEAAAKLQSATIFSAREERGSIARILGESVVRLDVAEKVRGETKFVADLYFDKMLHGKVVWSEYPYAEIISIDTSEATKDQGVVLVLTSKDVPGENLFGVLERDQPVLAEGVVRFIGEPVAVVFAENLVMAQEAARKVRVTYRQLAPVLSVYAALAEGAPQLSKKGNITTSIKLNRGDIDSAFSQADVTVEESFTTQPVEHAYIETEAAVATPWEEGTVTVYAGNQSPFADRAQLAPILGLKEEQVRVRHVPIGGAFGGKTELTVHAFVALAAMKTGRPAKIVLSRPESLRYHPKKHGYEMSYKVAAKKDGRILGMEVDIISDGGAYASWTPRVIEQSVAFSTGPYYIPNIRAKGTVFFTNNFVMGAMRGFGANQVHFAAESMLDILARKLDMDPISLREKNALELGLPMSTGQILREGVAYKETLEAIKPVVLNELMPLKQGDKDVGIGIACGWRSVAGGLGPDEGAGASLELLESGKVLFKTACTDMGQGSQTSLCQIISEVASVNIDDIQVVAGDTGLVPYGGGVMASRGVYLWGHSTTEAGKKFRNLLLSNGAQVLARPIEEIDLADSYFVEKVSRNKLLSLRQLAPNLKERLVVNEYVQLPKSYPMLEDANESLAIDPKVYKTHHTLAYNSTAIAVKVDTEKGNVDILHVVVALDSGRIINPEAARTQVEGGVIQAIGYTLTEKFVIEQGINKTNTLGKCRIPKITNIPRKITPIFVDSSDPTGPFGSKGVAEMGMLAITPAITNAIYDAVGIRIKSLPVHDALKAALLSSQNRRTK